MPDALSKTIPIWCSVINRVLFPGKPQCHDLHAPPQVVSSSEHAQITALLPSFKRALEALEVPLDNLKRNIPKPLRPMWVTPDSNITTTTTIFEDFHPIICCTVSRRVAGGEVSEGGYIQGAGDDTENWAYGLTPTVFWSNREALFFTGEGDLPDLIEELVGQGVVTGSEAGSLRCVQPTSFLFVAQTVALSAAGVSEDSLMIVLLPTISNQDTWATSRTRLDIGLGPHKVGSRSLRTALPYITDFLRKNLSDQKLAVKQIIVACESGKDLSIGAALAILCLFFDNEGKLTEASNPKIDKSFIRSRLGWVSTSMPDANPNRATLQSVNSYLMDRGFR